MTFAPAASTFWLLVTFPPLKAMKMWQQDVGYKNVTLKSKLSSEPDKWHLEWFHVHFHYLPWGKYIRKHSSRMRTARFSSSRGGSAQPHAVADLGDLGAPPPTAQNFLNFMQFFRKIWQNHMLAPPLEGWRPLLRRILDPPLPWMHTPL